MLLEVVQPVQTGPAQTAPKLVRSTRQLTSASSNLSVKPLRGKVLPWRWPLTGGSLDSRVIVFPRGRWSVVKKLLRQVMKAQWRPLDATESAKLVPSLVKESVSKEAGQWVWWGHLVRLGTSTWNKLGPLQCTQSTCLGATWVSPIKGAGKEAPSVQSWPAFGSLNLPLVGQLIGSITAGYKSHWLVNFGRLVAQYGYFTNRVLMTHFERWATWISCFDRIRLDSCLFL